MTIIVPLCGYIRGKSVSLPYIMCTRMRNRIIEIAVALAAFVGSSMMSTPVTAQVVELHDNMERIEDMLFRGRWSDALLDLDNFVDELDSTRNHFEQEWADYQRVRCAIGLGDKDAESMMIDYIDKYPASPYTNAMRYLLGTFYADRRQPEKAREVLEQVNYNALDKQQKARYDIRMGYILFMENRHDEALACFERISNRSLYRPHAQYFISYLDYIEGRNQEAREGFASLRSHDSYRRLIPFYMMQIDYREGKYKNVISGGEKLLETVSLDVRDDLVRIIAESYFVMEDYAQALRYIGEYPAEKYGRQEHYIRGYSLYRLGRYNDAVEPLKRVCGAADKLTQNASYHLGDCYLRSGDKSHAADAFAMASGEGFDDNIAREALLNYGRLKYELGGGRFNEAVNILNDYLSRYPGSEHETEVKQMLIASYYNSKNYIAAYVALSEFSNPDRELRAAHQKVALFCAVEAVKLGYLDKAEELLDVAAEIGLTPKYNALTLYWQGEVAAAKGEMRRAGQYYEAYLRRAPKSEAEYAFANYGMGYVAFSEGDMAKAAKSFDIFSRSYNSRDSYLYDALSRLGDAHYAMRDFKQARKAYNVVAKATSVERNYADYQLAIMDGIEGRTTSKIERLTAIVGRNDSDYTDDAWYELGHTYITSERFAEGAESLQQFVDENPSSPYYITALSELGLAYYNLERPSDARRCYEEVVAYDPLSSAAMEAMRGIREIYVAEGNVDAYFNYAERSGVQSDMGVAVRDSLTFAVARTAFLEGNYDSAREKLDSYLQNFESGFNRSEALFYLIDCRIQAGENGAAIEAMEELLGHGSTQYRERVLKVMAPMACDEGDYRRSAEAYRLLCGEATDAAVRRDASEGYVDAALLSEDNTVVEPMCDYIVAMADATPWAKRQAKLHKARILVSRGISGEAAELYADLATDRTTEEGAEAYYHLLAAKYDEGDYASVEQMVYDMGECGSMYWQAKAFLLLGDILVKRDNIFQARATYQSIVDGYSLKSDGIVEEARKRIAEL